MIRVQPVTADSLQVFSRHRRIVPNPLSGPHRHADKARALRLDLDEIAAAKGGVEEIDLLNRGWTAGDIVDLLPQARGLNTVERVRP